MKRIYRTPGRSGGFSLIEVMIAVVVLATGLLALAALQASLTRSAAEAKVRSRVAAMLTARMDELRGSGYDNAILNPGTTTTTSNSAGACDGDATDWIDCARGQANLDSLQVVQTNTLWTSAVGAPSFSSVTNRTDVGDGNPEFIRVSLEASWTDSSADTHRLGMTSQFSALALRDSLLPPPPRSNTATGGPVVRTDNPAGPGVIPIAVGGGDATAASNPRPEVIGSGKNSAAVGTRFDVLTYSGLSGPATIQRRVETTVIGCQCQYGAGGTNLPVIYRNAEWPAVWTGERYDLFVPAKSSSGTVPPAPGQAFSSGPKTGVEQSPLCTECCRDHHDTNPAVDPTVVAKFDPERVVTASQAHEHYMENGAGTLLAVANTNNADYMESCRMIRVDGFWRTAADMYSKHFGLLATRTAAEDPPRTPPVTSTKPATSGVPTATAAASYETFVKDFLNRYKTTTPTSADAAALFGESARSLNAPASITIDRPPTIDERYLHGRGLYVDYLEAKAKAKLAKVIADTGTGGKCEGAKAADCILPYLPFTTVNVTELAFWTPKKADDTDGSSVLSVASGSSLIYSPYQPTRGRTNALAGASGTADAVADISSSNSGVAIASAVDPDDSVEQTDRQVFAINAGTGSGGGDRFSVIVGGSALLQISDTSTTNDPAVAWGTDVPADGGNCNATVKLNNPNKDLNPNNYVCNTNAALGVAGSVTVANYWREYDSPTTKSFTHTCTSGTSTVTVTGNLTYPVFDNLEVSAAKVGLTQATALPGSIGLPINDGKKTESTRVTFAKIPANSFVWIDFAKTATVEATMASCTATRRNQNATWEFANVIWNTPWDQP